MDEASVQPSEPKPNYAFVGAGPGGLAMAAQAAISGHRVHVCDISPARLEVIRATGGIEARGEITGFGKVEVATDDFGDAVDGCELIMVAVPAAEHRSVAQHLAPHLRDGQTIVLNPGRVLGSLVFRRALDEAGCPADVCLAESQTFAYRARILGPGRVQVLHARESVPLATLPAHRIPETLMRLRSAFPQFIAGDTILRTSFNNVGSVLHPALMVLNAARIEDHDDFGFYARGASPSVCRILEALDAERTDVAAALGVSAMSATEWQYLGYGVDAPDLYTAIVSNPQYGELAAPKRLNHRYVREDIPTSLVPIASLGRAYGHPTRAIEDLITIAAAMTGEDYWAQGRTVERLGIDGLSLRQLRVLVVDGEVPPDTAGAADPQISEEGFDGRG